MKLTLALVLAVALTSCAAEAPRTKAKTEEPPRPTSPCLALFGIEMPMCDWKPEGDMELRLNRREPGRARVVNEARGLQPGVNKEFTQKREWTVTIEYEGNLPVANLVAAKYGYTRGATYSESETFTLNSRSCANWNIVETEVWRSGRATQIYRNSKTKETKQLDVPVRVLAYTTLTAVPIGCEVKPKVVANSLPPAPSPAKGE